MEQADPPDAKSWGKFKYPVLILLLGVLLLLCPGKSSSRPLGETTAPVEAQSSLGVEETRLANLLSRIQGAGAVEVMLSLKSGGRFSIKRTPASNRQRRHKETCGRRTIPCYATAAASPLWCSR